MRNNFRIFLFIFVLYVTSTYIALQLDFKGNVYWFILAISILIPYLLFPLYKQKAQKDGSSILSLSMESGTQLSGVFAIISGIIGIFTFSTFIESLGGMIFPIIQLILFVLYISFTSAVGFAIGGIIGIIIDLFTRKRG